MTSAQKVAKRLLDLAIAIPAVLLLGPLLIAIAACVRVHFGSPVFFRQQRPGEGGRPFWMLKFRTMSDARGPDGVLLPDEQRLSRFGKLLRETSLDELPELWNVIRGEMSLVGPRPLLMEYLDRYTSEQAKRHNVPPGITGWAQVNGRNAISWEQKFEYDLWYVENRGLMLDLKILLHTVAQVLTRHGIRSAGHATMPKFCMPESSQTPEAVAVIGVGGHAKVVIETLRAAGFQVSGIYDDNLDLHDQVIDGVPVRGTLDQLAKQSNARAIIAVGSCQWRAAVATRLPCQWISVVHPRAAVAPDVLLGEGTFVAAGVVVQAATRIGRHVIINTSASIDHDCRIGDFVHVAPGVRLAGEVEIQREALCGIGSVVLPRVQIGERSILGAGAVATKNIAKDCVAVGVPAIARPAAMSSNDRQAA